MFGIAGIIDFSNMHKLDENTLHQMAQALKFRGPDQEDYCFQNNTNFNFGLAHKRLSILDLSEAGRQPMWNAKKNCFISFKGEIYNFPSLKTRLEKEGAMFKSSSDKEVILVAYEFWGIEKTLQQLEGMLAFTLVEVEKQTVFIARDRFGEKPLYYHTKNDFFAFSSYIRSFGLVLIEKMASGLPIISFNGDGNEELIENGVDGFLMNKLEQNMFSTKIIELFGNLEEYNRISENTYNSA